jgi:2-methylcitrate dehydratase PrpD
MAFGTEVPPATASVVVDSKYQWQDAEWLAKRLREAYPQMKPDQIKPNHHSVCIKYAVSGLSFRLIGLDAAALATAAARAGDDAALAALRQREGARMESGPLADMFRLLTADQVRSARVRLPPYAHKLVGHPFQIGANPRVDAQFNAAYCVANALQRRGSKLAHFAPAQVADAQLRPLIDRIDVIADAALDARGHTAVDLEVTTTAGRVLTRALDIAPGFPGAELSDAQHRACFDDCVAYAPHPPSAAQVVRLLAAVEGAPALDDARQLAALLITLR